MKSIIGRKIGMTSVFAEDGSMYPVTVVEVLPNVVLQKKTKEKDGYEALQVGYEDKKESRATKPEIGIAKKANTTPKYFIREIEGDEIYGNHEVGSSVDATAFTAGEMVDVTGLSKGHGYSGVIKHYHYTIGPKGHGSGYHRQVGSLATNGRTNNRIHKFRVMSGQWRPKTRTVLHLAIVSIDPTKNVMLIRGSVPGPDYSIIKIRTTVRTAKPKFVASPIVDYTKETVSDIDKKESAILASKGPAKALKSGSKALKKANGKK
ncbi:MAG: 50S ribosomal protein L3 [Bacilli bacterium]|jgi:large subunit ribosomal protein L3|nr:50S ribosomal protein L3 [Bacilli bacterium]